MQPLRNFIRSQTTFGVRQKARELLKELRLMRVHRMSCHSAKHAIVSTPVRLHLGCGPIIKAGWVNVDMTSKEADLRLDLREPLPFPSNCALIVYSEHFFEHLEYPSEAGKFLAECKRVLVSGGVLSMGIPDFEGVVAAYVRRDDPHGGRYKRPSWVKTPMDSLNYAFRQGREHKYAYDFETLAGVLADKGFVDITNRPFDPELDSEYRRGSLYVSAKKP